MIARIESGENGQTANDLLKEFRKGYDLDNLRKLLHSDNVDAIAVGAFIGSELGEDFKPLLLEARFLLSFPNKSVRMDAINIVLMTAGADDGELVAQVVHLLRDRESGVRWKVIDFLSRVTLRTLEGAVAWTTDEEEASGLQWLVSKPDSNPQRIEGIIEKLNAGEAVTRLVAVAAARRLADHNSEPLKVAASSTDLDVRGFARGELDWLAQFSPT